MTGTEFSLEFDILYNGIMSNLAPGLNDYEKSVFLTQAQEELIIALYNGVLDGKPYEVSEDSKRHLSTLTSIMSPSPIFESSSPVSGIYASNSCLYNIPKNEVLFITYEQVDVKDNNNVTYKDLNVVPITKDEFFLIKKNPFRKASKDRIFRIDYGEYKTGTLAQNSVCIIPNEDIITILNYKISYIRRPAPIIIANNLPTINGISTSSEASLPDILHRTILKRAVEIAKSVWTGVN